MMLFALRVAISAVLIAVISVIARRSPGVAALVASLPLVSIIAMVWMWRDSTPAEKIAAHAEATFWYVLPSLPMFLVLPALLRAGVGFWIALVAVCLLTVLLYLGLVRIGPRFGIDL